MAATRRSTHLARNMVLAALAVLGTAAAVTLGAVRSGGGAQACPGGEDWVVAQPVTVAMAGYGAAAGAARPTAGATGSARTGSTAGSTAGAAPDAAPDAASAGAGAAPLELAGCVDTGRLHPVPLTGDGRG